MEIDRVDLERALVRVKCALNLVKLGCQEEAEEELLGLMDFLEHTLHPPEETKGGTIHVEAKQLTSNFHEPVR